MRSLSIALMITTLTLTALPVMAQTSSPSESQEQTLIPLVSPSHASASSSSEAAPNLNNSSPNTTPSSNSMPAPSAMASPQRASVPPGSASSVLSVETGSQKVPKGTLLTIAFNTPLDSRTTLQGEPFIASLTQDFTDFDPQGFKRVILPVGTIFRGRVSDVKRPTFLSHGGALYLDFDHVVLPSGELLPLSLKLSSENTKVNQKGGLYTDPGIGPKVHQGVEQGNQVFHNITQEGYKSGEQIAGGLGSFVTVPAAVVGGAVADAAVTTGKTAVAIFGKGESAVIHPGDTMTIDFGGSFVLPSE